ncbi:MAG: mechanosensitive ion channel family protein [Bacteroidetes bacterium]|nr:MAG: mechanosensitive ion channel family protein [Bacteroidota bacterium]
MDLTQTFNLLIDKLQGWLGALILALPNLVAAVLIVIGFAFAARLVRRLIVSGMDRVSAYRQVNKLLGTIGYLGVLAASVFIALGILDLDKTVTSLLAGAGIIGLALGFAFQDIATNFISGILLSIRRPFTEGDIIESNGYLGTVADVNLRSTKLRTFQGPLVIIPNKEIFQNPLTNYSELGQRRVDLSCGVAYGDDLDKARRVALEALEGLDVRDPNRPVELFYNAFGDSSINFTARFWIDFRKQTDFLHAQSEAIMRLKRAFDEHGITIPFPIRTLDFGVVGGEKLSDVLPPSLYATAPTNGS